MYNMFSYAGYDSSNFVLIFPIKNINMNYSMVFQNTVPKWNSKIILNYINETESIVDSIISNEGNPNIKKGDLLTN